MTDSSSDVTTGRITFVESFATPLEAGTYEISVTQELSNEHPQGDWDHIDESYSDRHVLVVQGERFSLSAEAVHTRFPAPGAEGEYANVLPHVLLERRTLPWERSPDATDVRRPWLALLAFDATDPPPEPRAARVGDLVRDHRFARTPGGTELSDSDLSPAVASYADAAAALGVGFELEYGESWSDECRVIDVPVALFNRIAPSLEDLTWLAHARRYSATGAEDDVTEVSVVVCNRLPSPNSTCTVHLVSLEGMSGFLPRGAAYDPSPPRLAGGAAAEAIRLVSLASWSFHSGDPVMDFAPRLMRADTKPFAVGVPDGMPASDGASIATAALRLGYTPLDHQLRTGDTSVSWYRGPLLPFSAAGAPAADSGIPADLAGPLVHTGDELLRYDPHTGMLDVSYASAWQLGRLLALDDPAFSIGLHEWRRRLVSATAGAVAHGVASEGLAGAVDLPPPQSGPASRRQAVARFVTEDVAGAVAAPAGNGAATALPVDGPSAAGRVVASGRSDDRRDIASALHADAVPPDPVVDWLQGLRRLERVPLGYLVPHEKLLPPESIRFFVIDQPWLDALVEGAMSVGRSTSADAHHDAVVAPNRRSATAGSAGSAPIAGALIRSETLSVWPQLHVRAFAAGTELPSVRKDTVAPGVLLVLFPGVFDTVWIDEPPLGLHFGVDEDGRKSIRCVTDATGRAAGSVLNDRRVDVALREGNVVALDAFAKRLHEALDANHANDDASGRPRSFTAAEMGLQMIEAAERVVFRVASARAGRADG